MVDGRRRRRRSVGISGNGGNRLEVDKQENLSILASSLSVQEMLSRS